MTAADRTILPGRLGSPDMVLRDDPRADPRMIAAMAPFGVDGRLEMVPPGDMSYEDLVALVGIVEEANEALFAAFTTGLAPVSGVERSVEVIRGMDGNDVTLFVHRPQGASGPLPGVLHLHGGGMVMLEAAGATYGRLRDELAAAGMVVVGVEFRNGAGKHGPYPFPAGLDDCTSALRWVADNKARLGISKLVVAGESGGGNLTLAVTLRAKREGRLQHIDGVYAMCPYISGVYSSPVPELPSLVENDGYLLDCVSMGAMVKVYDPTGANATNPLAWPYHADVAELAGLPPHVISVNQLDPLRDEGIAYYVKLARAGVTAVCRTVNGTCHAGDLLFSAVMPEVTQATLRDLKGFADSL